MKRDNDKCLPVYTEELAQEILVRLSDGESLSEICRDPKMPTHHAIHKWVHSNKEGFAARYTLAREFQAFLYADQVIDIADDCRNDWMRRTDPENPGWEANKEHINRTRLRLDTRKWIAARILSRIYGDKVQNSNQTLDKDGNPIDPVVPVVRLTIARE
jgi:hypothetical protein